MVNQIKIILFFSLRSLFAFCALICLSSSKTWADKKETCELVAEEIGSVAQLNLERQSIQKLKLMISATGREVNRAAENNLYRETLKFIRKWEEKLGLTMEGILGEAKNSNTKGVGVAMKFVAKQMELSPIEKAELWQALTGTLCMYSGTPLPDFQYRFEDSEGSIYFQGISYKSFYPTFKISKDGDTYFGKIQKLGKDRPLPKNSDFQPIRQDHEAPTTIRDLNFWVPGASAQ